MRIYVGPGERHLLEVTEAELGEPLVEISDDSGSTVREVMEELLENEVVRARFHDEEAVLGNVVLAQVRRDDDGIALEPLWTEDLFGVTEEGRLIASDDGMSNMTIAHLSRGVESGYLPSTHHDFCLILAPAYGGNGFFAVSIVDWLIHHFPAFVAGFAVQKAGDHALGTNERALQRAARAWAENSISHPRQLRAWLETRQSWSAAEVADRLAITEAAAATLLGELGFERNDRDAWILKSDIEALRRRDVWIFHEQDEFQQGLEDLRREY